jgi:hypothetical protein
LAGDFSGFVTPHQSEIYPPGLSASFPDNPKPVSFGRDNTVSILYPASIIPGKRQIDLILALVALKRKGCLNFRATFVGSAANPTYYQELRDLIVREDLGTSVRFRNFTDDISSEYNSADMVVSCSPMESFGRIILEGMAYGKVVIGAASGGTLELISHGKTGFLFEPANPEDLAEKMLFVLDHPSVTQQVIEQAREFSRQFFGLGGFQSLPGLVREFVRSDGDFMINVRQKMAGSTFYDSFLHGFFPWVLHLMEMRKSYFALEQENASLKNDIVKLQEEKAKSLEDISKIFSSRSWRITAPLRRIFKKKG